MKAVWWLALQLNIQLNVQLLLVNFDLPQTYYESVSRVNTLPHDGVLFHNIFAC